MPGHTELGQPGNVVPVSPQIERALKDALNTPQLPDKRSQIAHNAKTFFAILGGFAAAGGITYACSLATYAFYLYSK